MVNTNFVYKIVVIWERSPVILQLYEEEKGMKDELIYQIENEKNDVNLCIKLVAKLEKVAAEQRGELLSFFFEKFDADPNPNPDDLISKTELKELLLEYGPYTDDKLAWLIEQNLTSREFYEELAEFITSDPKLVNVIVRGVALFDLAIDRRLPYFPVNLNEVDTIGDLRFCQILQRIDGNTIRELDRTLIFPFKKKTQLASAVLSIIHRTDDKEEQIVWMSLVITHFQNLLLRRTLENNS